MSEKFERQTSFGWLINVSATLAARKLEAKLKQHDLSIGMWPTLMCLWEEEGVTQRDIAAKAKVESSTTTRALDKLEKLNLVERRPDPNSRRSFRIFLTEKGRELENEITPLPMEVNKELLAVLEPEEQKELIRILTKLADSA